MDMTETREGGTAVHDIAAIVEILLDEAVRADEPFLAYLLEIALREAAAVAARVPEAGGRLRPAAGAARALEAIAAPPAPAHP